MADPFVYTLDIHKTFEHSGQIEGESRRLHILELKDRVTIISVENMNGLTALYGNMEHDDLE